MNTEKNNLLKTDREFAQMSIDHGASARWRVIVDVGNSSPKPTEQYAK